jgi:5-methylcytosine-specific restriction endonuclease McrA
MKSYTHLADSSLLGELDTLDATDRGTTADLLGAIGEVDARKLYLPEGHPSMFVYCVNARKYSEDVAYKRIRAARAARRFPDIFVGIEQGRLNLSGVVLLAPHLTEATAEELLSGAAHKTNAEIERMLAERFPRPDLPTRLAPMTVDSPPATEPPSAEITQLAVRPVEPATQLLAVRPVESSAPGGMDVPRAKVTPLAPGRIGWQFTTGQGTQDLFREVQDLLGHDVPPGDVEAVLNFALRAGKEKLERHKFAATGHPRAGHRRSPSDSRYIPAEVRRAVLQRDGRRCTFTSETGHRCTERKGLEFDHMDPYAQDGTSTVSNVRLLCRAHNQYEAERAFGDEFMRHKRLAAAEARAAARDGGGARASAGNQAAAARGG